MRDYSEKSLINCVHADPGGCMCMLYFLDSKCDTFSLLTNTNDPENRFQKLNGIHRSRLSHWNCHTDSLTFVARSHFCHQTLAMINNATNDSGKLNCVMDTYLSSFAGQGSAKWSLSDRIMSNPDCIFCHSNGCKKVKKTYYWTIEPLSKLEYGGGETIIKTAEA